MLKSRKSTVPAEPNLRSESRRDRRSSHLPFAVSVVVSGQDEEGREFKEDTRTLGVDLRGARIATFHRIASGAEITIENRIRRQVAKARVVSLEKGNPPANPHEIVVELLGSFKADAIWGIQFPSQDRPRGQGSAVAPRLAEDGLPSNRGNDKSPELAPENGASSLELPQAEPPASPRPHSGKLSDATPLAAKEARKLFKDSQPGLGIEESSFLNEGARAADVAGKATQLIRAATEEGLSKLEAFRTEFETGSATRTELFSKTLEEASSERLGTFAQHLRELEVRFRDELQKAMEQAIEKQSGQATERLSKAAQEAANEIAGRAQRQVDDAIARLSQELEAAADRASTTAEELANLTKSQLQQHTEGAVARIEETVEAARSKWSRDIHEDLGGWKASALENLKQELVAALTHIPDRPEQAATEASEEARRAIQQAREAALGSLETAREEIEAVATRVLVESKENLREISTGGIRDLCEQAARLREDFQASLESTLQSRLNESTELLASRLAGSTTELIAQGVRSFRGQIDSTASQSENDLRKTAARIEEEIHQQLSAARESCLESIEQARRRTVEMLEKEAERSATESASAAADRVRLAQEQLLAAQHEHERKLKAGRTLEQAQMDDALGRLASARAEWQAACQAAIESHRQEVEKGLQGLNVWQAQLEGRLSSRLEEEAARSVGELRSEAAELERQASSLVTGFHDSLRERYKVSAAQYSDELAKTLSESVTRNARELRAEQQQSLEKARRVFLEESEHLSQAILDKARCQLQGLAPASPARSSATLKVVVALAAIIPSLTFLYVSTRPVMRLRPNPPPQLLDQSDEGATGEKQQIENSLALAYWNWAYIHLQDKYPYGTNLPEEPPADMEATGADYPQGVEADLAKRRYWQKLREVWRLPEAWEKYYPLRLK